MSDTSILIAPPGSLSVDDKEKLFSSGIVVIEHNSPEAFRFLRQQAELSHSDMLYAAMTAIQRGDDTLTKSVFSKIMASIVIKNKEAVDNQKPAAE